MNTSKARSSDNGLPSASFHLRFPQTVQRSCPRLEGLPPSEQHRPRHCLYRDDCGALRHRVRQRVHQGLVATKPDGKGAKAAAPICKDDQADCGDRGLDYSEMSFIEQGTDERGSLVLQSDFKAILRLNRFLVRRS